jgi:hypothetical protein
MDDGRDAPFYLIVFDKEGRCQSPVSLAKLLDEVNSSLYSHVHVFSHGWNNVFDDAVGLYRGFFDHYFGLRKTYAPSKPEYRPAMVGIIWPSTLLVPMENKWLAVEKVVAGMVQSIVSGLVVIPAAWLTMGSGLNVSFGQPLEFAAVVVLVAALAGTGGLLLGCSVGQTQIGLMFSMVIAPMMMFGCAYYPWEALKNFPGLQYAVLINPLVYASEGLRGSLAPQVPHIPIPFVLGGLLAMNAIFLWFGLKKFQSKAVS